MTEHIHNTRKILISEGFLRERIADLEYSIQDIKEQIRLPDQSNKTRKRLMKGELRVTGRIRELRAILSCLSESHTKHLVEVN